MLHAKKGCNHLCYVGVQSSDSQYLCPPPLWWAGWAVRVTIVHGAKIYKGLYLL